MANNKIQIKRSATTATPSSLSAGELAFSNVAGGSGVLFIGSTDGGTVVPVGGVRNPGTLTANQALVANATSGIDKIIVANAAISQLNANGATGTAGYVLKSGGAGSNSYWDTPPAVVAGSNSQVQFNANGSLAGDAGLTYDGVTDILSVGGSVNVGANVSVNTTALDVGATTFTTANAIFGGTLAVNGSIGTAGQLLISGGSTNAYFGNSLGVFSFTDLTVSGNLSVLGDLVSLNVSTLAIEDPLIVLAKDQSATTTYTDAVDIGFVAPYGNTLASSANWTGIFRDQSDSGIYKLFSGNIPTPTTTVDTTNVNFTFATFQSQLKAGGVGAGAFIANTSHVNITANSTVNVFITANTLALSTALPVTSGGIGTGTIAVGDLLVGNSTNTISKLTAGTDGYVLQINGTGVVAWNTLDGGTF